MPLHEMLISIENTRAVAIKPIRLGMRSDWEYVIWNAGGANES